MNPKYLLYAVVGIFFGLIIGAGITWPASLFFGRYGYVVAPYIMGIVLMVLIEYFIIEGAGFIKERNTRRRLIP